MGLLKDTLTAAFRELGVKNSSFIQKVMSVFKAKTLEKNDFFIKENHFDNKVGIVLNGKFISTTTTSGQQVVNNFFLKHGWLGDLKGYMGRANTTSIRSMCRSEVLYMDSICIRQELGNSPELKRIEQFFSTQIMCNTSNQLATFKTLSPEQRYLKLKNERPLVISSFLNTQIASYLGVSPETLSRIKKRSALQD